MHGETLKFNKVVYTVLTQHQYITNVLVLY